ncbi:MAG: hypothetical protein QNJ55_31820 [Xenococcus sp. MO_188.B8]|nr:hypothetical protein [Xenococcus sp. MO_188.B8]
MGFSDIFRLRPRHSLIFRGHLHTAIAFTLPQLLVLFGLIIDRHMRERRSTSSVITAIALIQKSRKTLIV